MLKIEPFTRKEFDEAVEAVFPKAVRSRKEHEHGWTDTLDLNLIRLILTVYSERKGFYRPGDVMVELVGVRTALDGSAAVLWSRKTAYLSGLQNALTDLRQRLMGLAAALLSTCGDPAALPKPILGPAKRDTPQDPDDLSGLFQ